PAVEAEPDHVAPPVPSRAASLTPASVLIWACYRTAAIVIWEAPRELYFACSRRPIRRLIGVAEPVGSQAGELFGQFDPGEAAAELDGGQAGGAGPREDVEH